MTDVRSPNTNWRDRLRNAYAIHNVVVLRPSLPIYLVTWHRDRPVEPGEKPLEWMDLGQPNNLMLRPHHFETYFGKDHVRDAHYLRAIAQAWETRDIVVSEIFGTWDLFAPLPLPSDEPPTVIHAGHFLQAAPTWETVAASWSAMTGQEATSANRDFIHYVRMMLDLPVFEPPLLEAVKEFFSLYARYLVDGMDDVSIRERVDALNSGPFARYWPIRDWVDAIISPNKFLPPPWHFVGALTDWMKVGIGIERLPTTAMALMPLDARSEPVDLVQAMLRNAHIQRECIKFARNLPETAATRLQDYGVSIVTSASPGKNEVQARVELRDTAHKFREFVQERFGVNAAVGIGRSLPPGAPLHESHEEAVLSLHMCVQLSKDVLFYDEHGDADKFRYANIQYAAEELRDALNLESPTALKLAADRYVHLVLRYANHRIEVVRGQFLATLFQMLHAVQRRNPMREDARESFWEDLAERIEETQSIEQLIDSFNEALGRLSFVATKAWRGPSVMLLEATLQYLRENYTESLPLPLMAKKAGFSVPVFTRVFKQATGMSYLNYLRNIRVEQAKKLLVTTMLTLEQVAQQCGFNSQHHLIRSFKKVTGMTPGAYRRKYATVSPAPDGEGEADEEEA